MLPTLFKKKSILTLIKIGIQLIVVIIFWRYTYQQGDRIVVSSPSWNSSAQYSANDRSVDQLVSINADVIVWPRTKKTFNEYLASRKQSTFIKGQVYNITSKPRQQLFKELGSQNIPIHILLENKQYKWSQNQFETISQNLNLPSISLKGDDHLGTNFVHSKFFINQNQRVIQTANLTHSSYFTNREHFVIGRDPNIREHLQQLFDNDRTDKPHQPFHPNIVVCPLNCRQIIQNLLASAQTNIKWYQQYITDPSIVDLLKKKKSDGINVQIIVSDNTSNNHLIRYLSRKHIKIMKKPYIHSKAFLVDERWLLIGSMNMSTNSLDKNREVGIILIDQSQISSFLQQFNTDWWL